MDTVSYHLPQVILEKRLGIAQLCLLLTVLVFMALTRGSRSEPLQGLRDTRSRTQSLPGWGSRTFNLRNDLVNRLKNRSLSPPESVSRHIRSASDDLPMSAGESSCAKIQLSH